MNTFWFITRTQNRRQALFLEALRSISVQAISCRVVVVVHGPTRDRLEVEDLIRSFKNMEPIVLHEPSEDALRGKLLNLALDEILNLSSPKDFVCFLDDDDIIYPNFTTAIAGASERMEADVFYGKSNKRLGQNPPEDSGFKPHHPLTLLKENFIPINSFAVRLDKVAGHEIRFSERLEYLEDWHFLVNLLNHGFKFAQVAEVISEFSIRDDGSYSVNADPSTWMKCARVVEGEARSAQLAISGQDIIDLIDSQRGLAAADAKPLRLRHHVAIRAVDRAFAMLGIARHYLRAPIFGVKNDRG